MTDKDFKVAYRTTYNEKSLNGYTGSEMLRMFTANPVPNNIYFSEEWHGIFCKMHNYVGCYVNHYGGAIGSDTMWGGVRRPVRSRVRALLARQKNTKREPRAY